MSSPGRCLDCLITVDCPLPLTQDDADLTNVSLPHLRRITGSITVQNNPALVRIVLPNLEAIGQSLALLDNPRLAAVELPLLETISRDFSVRGGGSDAELALPRLAAIGGEADVRDTTFAGLVMPMLDYIAGYLFTSGLQSGGVMPLPHTRCLTPTRTADSNRSTLPPRDAPYYPLTLIHVRTAEVPCCLPAQALSRLALPALRTVTGNSFMVTANPMLKCIQFSEGLDVDR